MISVVMPAHNEEGYLEGAVRRVAAGAADLREPVEILVCENGSSDGTARLADALAGEVPGLRALHLDAADYGRALRRGFEASRGDLVANVDVDSVDLGFLVAARRLLRDRPEVVLVVGTKRGPGAADHRHLGRQAVTLAFSWVLRAGFRLGVSDTHGLKVLRRAPLEPVVAACRFGADIFDTELVLRAERAGLAVAEIPIEVREQRPPRTSIVRRIPRSLAGLARLRAALWREALSGPRSRAAATRR